MSDKPILPRSGRSGGKKTKKKGEEEKNGSSGGKKKSWDKYHGRSGAPTYKWPERETIGDRSYPIFRSPGEQPQAYGAAARAQCIDHQVERRVERFRRHVATMAARKRQRLLHSTPAPIPAVPVQEPMPVSDVAQGAPVAKAVRKPRASTAKRVGQKRAPARSKKVKS